MDDIIVEKMGNIAQIIFNQPKKKNAITLEMWRTIGTIATRFSRDDEILAIIIRGAGDEAFSAGADISEFHSNRSSRTRTAEYNQTMINSLTALDNVNKPTIAMIQGYCIGGGMSLALHCDIRIADETSRFSIPAAKLGLAYHWEEVKLLTETVGPAFAHEILCTGRQFRADEALQMRLVNRLRAKEEIISYVMEYAYDIVKNAPLTLTAIKKMLQEVTKNPADQNIPLMNSLVDACFNSEDYQEGHQAFIQKRSPVFKGQ
tara:strand:- start:2738 stop:3520 length:783 start_codon:yes stop_codon:yes gene_type:complete